MANKQTILVKARQLNKLWEEYVDMYVEVSLHPDLTTDQLLELRGKLIEMHKMTTRVNKLVHDKLGPIAENVISLKTRRIRQ